MEKKLDGRALLKKATAEFARSYKRYAEARALPKVNRPLPPPSTTP